MSSRAFTALAMCALAVACSGGASGGAAKPDRASGAEAISGAEGAPTVQARPARAADLAVRVVGPSPVGIIADEAGRAYPLGVEIRNLSSDPISLAPAFLHIAVYRRSIQVEGCTDPVPRPIELDEPIAPGVSAHLGATLPCALPEPGDYQVAVVLVTADDAATPRMDARVSGILRLSIDGSLPPFSGDAAELSDP